jgi:hypothetical protein
MTLASLLLRALLAVTFLGAQPSDSASMPDAGAAFAKLQSLSGTWESIDADGKKSRVRYEVIAANSAVVEHFASEKMGAEDAMVTVYYRDGGRLLLQHYCMAKNQPRMQADSFDADKGKLHFDFLDASGLASPQAGHMHSVTFYFTDADHMSQEWQFVENGKPKFTETAQYTRQR